LGSCEFFLVYLNGRTWCQGNKSAIFAMEVETAMRRKVNLLLCHEVD
jgi:hypothetical protein